MTDIARRIVATLGIALACGAAQAGDINWSIGISLPPVATVISNAPVHRGYHVPPPPVYYAPPPVVYRPAPIYYAPPPAVVYAPVPRYYRPPHHHRHWHKHDRHWGPPHHRHWDRDDDDHRHGRGGYWRDRD